MASLYGTCTLELRNPNFDASEAAMPNGAHQGKRDKPINAGTVTTGTAP
jgi:hypothetical protein